MPNIDEKYLLSPHKMNECAIDIFSDCIFSLESVSGIVVYPKEFFE